MPRDVIRDFQVVDQHVERCDRGHDEGEDTEESSRDVTVDEEEARQGSAAAGCGDRAFGGSGGGVRAGPADLGRDGPGRRFEREREDALVAPHASQGVSAEGEQEEVRQPHGETGRHAALDGAGLAGGEESVVEEDDRDGYRKPGRAAPAPVDDSEGESDQTEDEAGGR
jgi:hypothetical protein